MEGGWCQTQEGHSSQGEQERGTFPSGSPDSVWPRTALPLQPLDTELSPSPVQSHTESSFNWKVFRVRAVTGDRNGRLAALVNA